MPFRSAQRGSDSATGKGLKPKAPTALYYLCPRSSSPNIPFALGEQSRIDRIRDIPLISSGLTKLVRPPDELNSSGGLTDLVSPLLIS